MSKVVYAWDALDPRSEKQRNEALFDFVYEGYQGSVWVPQASLEGNWLTRVFLGDSRTIASSRVGLVPWTENEVVAAYGMAPNPTPGQPLGWSINCLVCHTAEIDGVAYFGAGAKTLDEKIARFDCPVAASACIACVCAIDSRFEMTTPCPRKKSPYTV